MEGVGQPDPQHIGQPAGGAKRLDGGTQDGHVLRDGPPGGVQITHRSRLQPGEEERVGQRLRVSVGEVVRLHVRHQAAAVELP